MIPVDFPLLDRAPALTKHLPIPLIWLHHQTLVYTYREQNTPSHYTNTETNTETTIQRQKYRNKNTETNTNTDTNTETNTDAR